MSIHHHTYQSPHPFPLLQVEGELAAIRAAIEAEKELDEGAWVDLFAAKECMWYRVGALVCWCVGVGLIWMGGRLECVGAFIGLCVGLIGWVGVPRLHSSLPSFLLLLTQHPTLPYPTKR